jgi:multisubunit Na+/H+ antiporter MnhC subunit
MKKYTLIAWILIWYGVIFLVQENDLVRNLGLILWGMGISLQFAIVAAKLSQIRVPVPR